VIFINFLESYYEGFNEMRKKIGRVRKEIEHKRIIVVLLLVHPLPSHPMKEFTMLKYLLQAIFQTYTRQHPTILQQFSPTMVRNFTTKEMKNNIV
jgi:hypothetical protein